MKFLTQILSCCLLISVVIATRIKRQANRCNTPDNYIGVCVTLPNCPSLLQLYASNNGSPQVVSYLRAARRNCGNQVWRGEPVMCCSQAYQGNQRPGFNQQQSTNSPFFTIPTPQTLRPNRPSPGEENVEPPTTQRTTTFIPPPPPTQAPIQQRADDCRGPDARTGSCQSLLECPELLKRLQSNPNDQSFAQFLRLSNEACQTSPPIVCCPGKQNDGNIIPIPTQATVLPVTDTIEARILTPDEGCGQSGIAHRKIVGGVPSELGSWPWIALIGYTDSLGETSYRCGGSLITKRHVVTAAHCINNNLKSVRLGEHNLGTDTEVQHVNVNVVRVARHPSYDKRDGHSDVAVLYLGSDVPFSKTIRPVCVPRRSDFQTRSIIGYTPFVAGWGKTLEGGESAQTLQEVQLPVLANSECKKRYEIQKRLISEKQFDSAIICAGVLTGGKDTCQGDSGGPLMLPEKLARTDQFYYNLIGVVSYGVGCARAGIPGVYASVPHFADWIREKVAEPI